jgi:Ca2+:H+ antiporter
VRIPRFELYLAVAGGVLVSAAAALRFLGGDPVTTFAVAASSIIPLSHFMGLGTEELGKHAGPGIGGLLNASFGNATELIIAVFAILAGPQLYDVVRASLTGSIIGNILLILGLSMLVGGLRYPRQTFGRQAATTRSTMMALAVVALLTPSVAFYSLSFRGAPPEALGFLAPLSEEIAFILLVAYGLGLLFSLRTHRHLFNPLRDVEESEEDKPKWSVRFALLVLLGATALVSVASEVLVHTLEDIIQGTGLNELFVGVIVVAVIGNAAEHSSAIHMAWKNRMELSVGIATSSSIQIALFVAPILVLVSALLPGGPLTLTFELFELLAIVLATAVVNMVSSDGESNWYEGALLVLVYVIIAIGFYFHPPIP